MVYWHRLLSGIRFVRLPIPGCEQLDLLNARLSDCETQANQLLRVPFLRSGQSLEAWSNLQDANFFRQCSILRSRAGRNAWKERAAVEVPPQATDILSLQACGAACALSWGWFGQDAVAQTVAHAMPSSKPTGDELECLDAIVSLANHLGPQQIMSLSPNLC